MSATDTRTRGVAVPAMQMREIIDLLTKVANDDEDELSQAQARILANSLSNRLNDANEEANR